MSQSNSLICVDLISTIIANWSIQISFETTPLRVSGKKFFHEVKKLCCWTYSNQRHRVRNFRSTNFLAINKTGWPEMQQNAIILIEKFAPLSRSDQIREFDLTTLYRQSLSANMLIMILHSKSRKRTIWCSRLLFVYTSSRKIAWRNMRKLFLAATLHCGMIGN